MRNKTVNDSFTLLKGSPNLRQSVAAAKISKDNSSFNARSSDTTSYKKTEIGGQFDFKSS